MKAACTIWLVFCLTTHLSAQGLPLEIVPGAAEGLPGVAAGGLPVPAGVEIHSGAEVKVVNASGQEVPAEVRILARRRAAGGTPGSARWLHVAALVPARPGGEVRLLPRKASEKPPDPLAPPDASGRLAVGKTTYRIGDGRPVLLTEVETGGARLPLGLRITLRGEKGETIAFSPGPPVTERTSPLRIVLRWHARLSDGLEVTARATFTRNLPWFRFSVRIENPGPIPEHATRYFKDLSVHLVAPPGMKEGCDTLAMRALPLVIDMPAPAAPTPRKQRVLAFHLRSGDTESSGYRHGGAVGLTGGSHSLQVALLHAAEEAPTRLRVEVGRIRVQLLPEGGSGPHYRGRYGDPRKPKGRIDPRSLAAYRFEGGRWKTFDLAIRAGVCRTSPADLRELAAALEKPPLLHAPLADLVDRRPTAILLPTWSPDPDVSEVRYRRMIEILVSDAAADPLRGLGRIGLPGFLARGGTFGGWNPYGWFNFGDVPWGEGYSSLHYDFPRTLFAAWLASPGDRRFMDMGVRMARHLRDIDFVHGGDADHQLGAQRYEKGWWHGNAFGPSTSHTWVTGLFLHYVLTGDPGTRETLDQAGAWFLARKTEEWSGLWGARMVGWPIDNLVTLHLLDGDPRYLEKAKATIERFEALEQAHGGHGYVLNEGWRKESARLPARHQSWMQAIVLAAAARYVRVSGDRKPLGLIRRMTDHLVSETYVPPHRSGRGYMPAAVWEFWAPGGYKKHLSVHLAWVLLDALSQAALVLDDRKVLGTASEIFESLTRFHQWSSKRPPVHPERPSTWSPISARMTTFPGSESKILSNIGRFGMSFLAARRVMGQ